MKDNPEVQSDDNADAKLTIEGEIDILQLIKEIWSRKITVIKVVIPFIILGFIIALTSPEEYNASSVLIAESASGGQGLGGSLGGLASLAGVNLNSIGGDSKGINPALYQSVSQSTPFLLELMNQEYYFEEVGKTIKVSEYYEDFYKKSLFSKALSLPGTVLGLFKSQESQAIGSTMNDAYRLTKEDAKRIDNLKGRVVVDMDWDLDVVKVKVEMQDPVVAAEMVRFTQNYITDYVTEYAILKSQQQLKSIEKEYQERKEEFERAQYRLASFRDKNKNVTSARAKSEEERLVSVYTLAFNIYNQLAQQREAIKLQIQEETPVFTVLEPVRVPVEKSEPKRLFILIGFTIFGGFVGIGIVILKIFLWKK